jgi:Flp pilus assembly protein TadG
MGRVAHVRGRHPTPPGPVAARRRRWLGARGAALVELGLILPVFALLGFSAIDVGRMGQYQNRMSNAAREGAAIAQFSPRSVNTGCNGTRNVVDRVKAQNPSLATAPGYSVTIGKKDTSTGVVTTYTGCNTASNGVTIAPGDRLVVTVKLTITMSGPITAKALGNTVQLVRKNEFVVQG